MAFKIALTPSYKVKVTVETPNDNNGFDKSTFNAEFKRIGMQEAEKLRELTQREAIKEVLLGFKELVDGDGNQVEFNDTNVEILLDIPQAQLALAQAFWTSIFQVKQKN